LARLREDRGEIKYVNPKGGCKRTSHIRMTVKTMGFH